MDKRDFYYGEIVTEATLDQSFDWAEDADQNLAAETGMEGIHTGLTVAEQAVPDLTVAVAGGAATGPDGERIYVAAPSTTVDCSVDRYGTTTAVGGPGNEKYLAIYARFTRNATNPAVDDNGVTVYTRQYEAAEFLVEQGVEAIIPTAVRPALLADAVHLADVRLVAGQIAITNADLTVTRRGDWVREVLTNLGSVAVYGTPQAACAALWQAIDALASATGADNVGADDYTTANAHVTWAAASVQDALEATADAIDGHIVGGAPNHPASAISTAVIAGTPESEAAPSEVQAVLANVFTHLNARTERNTIERVTQPWDIGSDTTETEDDTRSRMRGSILIGTIAGGSWGKFVDLEDIAARLYPGSYPLGSPMAASNSILLPGISIAGTAMVVRASTVHTSKQRRLIAIMTDALGVAGTGISGTCRLYDPHNPAAAAVATVALGSLPTAAGARWKARAMCSSGTELFVLFYDTVNQAWRVQAYDATSNTLPRVTAWPATGIDPTPGFTGPEGAGMAIPRSVSICMASATKVATCNGWVLLSAGGRPALSVFNAADGGGLVSGDGDVTPAANVAPSGGLCSDGTYLYWTSQMGTATFNCVLQSAQISSPGSGRGGWTTHSLGVATGVTKSRCHSLAWTGEAVFAPVEDGSMYATSTVSPSSVKSTFGAHGSIAALGYAAFDGLRVWALGKGTTDGLVAIGVDASWAHTFDTGLDLSEIGARYVSLMRLDEAATVPPDVSDMGPMLFDGDAIWATLNDGQDLGSAGMLGYTRAIRASSRR